MSNLQIIEKQYEIIEAQNRIIRAQAETLEQLGVIVLEEERAAAQELYVQLLGSGESPFDIEDVEM